MESNLICYSLVLQTTAMPRLVHFAQLMSSSLPSGSHICIMKFADNPAVFTAPLRPLVRYSGHSNRLSRAKRLTVIGWKLRNKNIRNGLQNNWYLQFTHLQMNGWHDFTEYMGQWLFDAYAIPMRCLQMQTIDKNASERCRQSAGKTKTTKLSHLFDR